MRVVRDLSTVKLKVQRSDIDWRVARREPTTPTAGQVLKWNGTAWDVASDDGIITETDPAWAADKAALLAFVNGL